VRKSNLLSKLIGVTSNKSFHHKNIEYIPSLNKYLGVLFLARVWPPGEVKDKVAEESYMINHSRAECIRRCRKEFCGNFLGGIVHDEYSMKHYSDYLVEDPTITKKLKYLKKLKEYDICIATTGLHGSIGL